MIEDSRIERVLDFWFGKLGDEKTIPETSKFWFAKDSNFDKAIESRFLELWTEAKDGKLAAWESIPRGQLALTLVRDQFSRNLFRNSSKAFEEDPAALRLTLKMIESKNDETFFPIQRVFVYLPLEHSENLEFQRLSVRKFEELVLNSPLEMREYLADNLKYAVRHFEIIEKFGRFPHRNEILGRKSTGKELEFLKEPMSAF